MNGAVGLKGAGRVVVVTRAATVCTLMADGWSVPAVDDPALPGPMAPEAELADVVVDAGRIAGSPDRVSLFIADVRDLAFVEAADVERRWDGLGAAVAATGVTADGVPLWQGPLAQKRAVLDTDLGGVLTPARTTVPALLRRAEPRSGRFLAVVSAVATRGLPILAAYRAAKTGVAGLIGALNFELGGTGVTAIAVSPGSTDITIQAGNACGMTGAVVPVDGGLAL
ncbi:SDR family NAD(P)-dependent oxidoreductase [Streptomyces sp. NPDC051572]|uniref:SDR family NAD(P)-dependent oxidoreductase n=1 Tax=unclassified Streptomyces TaxID=2593676 RepID=UPI00344D5626